MGGLSGTELSNCVLSVVHMENGHAQHVSGGKGCALVEAIDPGAWTDSGAPQTFLRADGTKISAHF